MMLIGVILLNLILNSSARPEIGPSIHLLLPDNLLDQFGCLFGCGEAEAGDEYGEHGGQDGGQTGQGGVAGHGGQDGGQGGLGEQGENTEQDIPSALEVTGLDIVNADDISLPSLSGSFCNQNGCNGHSLAAIPHPDSKPVIVLLGEDDDNQTNIVILGDQEDQEILGQSGLMAALLNSLFNTDPTSVLSFDPSDVEGSIAAMPEDGERNNMDKVTFIPDGIPPLHGEIPSSGAPSNPSDGPSTPEEVSPSPTKRPSITEDVSSVTDAVQNIPEEALPSYNEIGDTADQLSPYAPGAEGSFVERERSQVRTGRRQELGAVNLLEEFTQNNLEEDIVDDVRPLMAEDTREEGENIPSTNIDFRHRQEISCAADMSCVRPDECGANGVVKGGRNARQFHVGGRGMLQRCLIHRGGQEIRGFCCRNNI